MTDSDDHLVRRLELLETNVSGQSVALNALLSAFETLSGSLAELAEDGDGSEDLGERVEALERRHQQLIAVVRDMHVALEVLFRQMRDDVDTYHSHERDLAALEAQAAAAPGGDSSIEVAAD
ncbi:MAG: hypothetical protein ABI276_01610 [Acidimicrobiales bacterium]